MKGQAALLTACGIGVTLILLLGASWLGPAGAMFNLLTPVAATYLGMRFGPSRALIVVVVVSLLLLQLAPVHTLVVYLSLFGVGSLVLPFLLRRQLPWDHAVFGSVLGALGFALLMVVAAVASEGSSVSGIIDNLIQAEIEQAMQIYRDAGFNAAQLQEMQAVVNQIGQFVEQTFFGLCAASILAIQLLNLLILQRVRGNFYQIVGLSFAHWRLPAALIWLLIAAGFVALIPFPTVKLVGYNLLVMLLPLYFLQGLAVVSSFLQRKAYSTLFKSTIYLLLFILSPMPLIITGVGVFDLWIDFRRPRNKEK